MFKISLYKIYRFHFSSKYKSNILYQNSVTQSIKYCKIQIKIPLRKASNIAKFKSKFRYAKHQILQNSNQNSVTQSIKYCKIQIKIPLSKASNIAKFKFKALSVTSHINSSQTAVTPKQTDARHRQVFSHMVLCN